MTRTDAIAIAGEPIIEVSMRTRSLIALLLLAVVAPTADAQLRATRSLTLEGAKNIMAAAEAEAVKNNWAVAIAIVDPAGELLFFQRGNNTRPSNVEFAIGKARTSARFQRESRLIDSAVNAGRVQFLGTSALAIEGGVPIIVDGQIIGAVGVSGVTAAQDAQIARAGIAALRHTVP